MTEEKNTKTIEGNAPVDPNNAGMSGAAVPPVGGNITPVDNTPENNSLAVQEENYPVAQNTPEKTLNVEETKDSRTLTAEELKSKRYQKGLTVEEAKKLEDLEAENNGEGKLSQENKKDIPYRERDPYKLEEGDIIEVMYKGLLKDIMVIDAWVSKHFWHGYDSLLYDLKNREPKEKDFKLDNRYKENNDTIKLSAAKKTDDAKKVSEAISKGTLFDEKNKDLLNTFKDMTKDNPQGQKIVEQVKQACDTYKATPDSADKKENKAQCEKMSKVFFTFAATQIIYDAKIMHTANNMAYAEMLHRNELRNRPKEMEKTFDETYKTYKDGLQEKTKAEHLKTTATLTNDVMTSDKVASSKSISKTYNSFAPINANLEKMSQSAILYAQAEGTKTQSNPFIEHMRGNLSMRPREITQPTISGRMDEAAQQLQSSPNSEEYLKGIDSRISELDAQANSPERQNIGNRIHHLRNNRDGTRSHGNRFLNNRNSGRQ